MEVRIIKTSEDYEKECNLIADTRKRGCVHCGNQDKLDIYRNHFVGGLVLTCRCLNCGTHYEVDYGKEL